MPRYFEEFTVGMSWDHGAYAVTRDGVVAFARRFDPQPFHLDEAAAAATPYGGLIASGWHTTAICMRLMVEALGPQTESLGSPGADEIRWRRPVRPGDALSVHLEVVARRRSRRADRGLITLAVTLRNQRDEVVLTMRALGMIRCRPASATADRTPEVTPAP